LHFGFEDFSFFGSLFVDGSNVALIASHFSLLGALDSSQDLSEGVQLSFQFGFQLDSLGITDSDLGIVPVDVKVASLLEVSVRLVIDFLFSNVSVLQVVKGAKKSV
jgi:hypothetical protein